MTFRPQRYSNSPSSRGFRPNISLEVTPEQFKAVDDVARAKDVSRGAILRELINLYILKKPEDKNNPPTSAKAL